MAKGWGGGGGMHKLHNFPGYRAPGVNKIRIYGDAFADSSFRFPGRGSLNLFRPWTTASGSTPSRGRGDRSSCLRSLSLVSVSLSPTATRAPRSCSRTAGASPGPAGSGPCWGATRAARSCAAMPSPTAGCRRSAKEIVKAVSAREIRARTSTPSASTGPGGGMKQRCRDDARDLAQRQEG